MSLQVSKPVPKVRRGASEEKRSPGAPRLRSTLARIRSAIEAVPLPTAIFGVVTWLCCIGLVMVLGASAFDSLIVYGSVWSIFEREVLWLGLGFLALLAVLRVDTTFWRRLRVVMMIGGLLLLVAVLVPGVGVRTGGSSRWIGFGQLRVQPSELMKFAFAVFAADLVARRSAIAKEARQVVAPVLVLLGAVCLLVLAQPDMGTAVVIGCIGFGLLVASGVRARSVAKVLGALAVFSGLAALAEPYRRARLLSFVNPFAHANGSGYQVVQSLVGLGSGHLTGVGIGGGHQVWGLLPNAQTDFIFSVIGEQAGLLGTLLVIASFGLLAFLGLRAAAGARDRFDSFLAVAVTCWLVSQAVINVGAVIGLMPVTGIPLPFVSYGGSAMVVDMAGAGLLVRIARNGLHRTAPARTAPARTAPTRTAPTRTAPTRTAPTRTAPTRTAPTRTAPTRTALSRTAPTRTALSRRSGV
ncbi:MAG: putative lipid II flippase FtsW [Actinomycetota bacterium]|nr:putative lipid II flippase FtsW [Actinomycetota bacterium]